MMRNPCNDFQERSKWPTFREYCVIRDFLQMYINSNGCPIVNYGIDNRTFENLISMENQWQYLRRTSGIFSAETYQYPNNFQQWSQLPQYEDTPACNRTVQGEENGVNEKRKIKRTRRVKKVEGKPKRPLTSFMLFLKDYRVSIVSSLPPGSSSHDVNREAGKKWHLLPESEKERYKQIAAEALVQWKRENADHFPNFNRTVKEELPLEPSAIAEHSKKRSRESVFDVSEEPKKESQSESSDSASSTSDSSST